MSSLDHNEIGKPLVIGSHPLPGLWKTMLPEDFQFFQLPTEHSSPCHACPQVKAQGFRPDYRCCTYEPRIPNFMLGLALLDENEFASKSIKIRVEGQFLLPEGSQATPASWYASIVQNSEGLFGKGDTIVCPFLDKSKRACGIHNYRNSVCSTFFCNYDHGNRGDEFWSHLQTLALQIETSLSQEFMERLGFDISHYFDFLDSQADRLKACTREDFSWESDIYRELWGQWYGRELDFFKECGKLAIELSPQLYELANGRAIKQCKKLEKATYDTVEERHHEERDRDPFVDGDPVKISQLWYELQAQHKQLWNIDPAKQYCISEGISFKLSDKEAKCGSAGQLFFNERFLLNLGSEDCKIWHLLKNSTELSLQNLLSSYDDYMALRSFMVRCIHRGILTPLL